MFEQRQDGNRVPPSPTNSLCQDAAEEGSSNTSDTENCSNDAREGRNFGGLETECNENVASTCDACSACALNGSSYNESSAVSGDTCLDSAWKINPGTLKLRSLPQTRLHTSNTRIEERNVVFKGKYLYAFPQKDTNAARHMKNAEPYQPT